jgi:hypothetical protein
MLVFAHLRDGCLPCLTPLSWPGAGLPRSEQRERVAGLALGNSTGSSIRGGARSGDEGRHPPKVRRTSA